MKGRINQGSKRLEEQVGLIQIDAQYQNIHFTEYVRSDSDKKTLSIWFSICIKRYIMFTIVLHQAVIGNE